jgi:hypothetical protein
VLTKGNSIAWHGGHLSNVRLPAVLLNLSLTCFRSVHSLVDAAMTTPRLDVDVDAGRARRRPKADELVWRRRRKTALPGSLQHFNTGHVDYHEAISSLLWQPCECCRAATTGTSSLCHDGDLSLLWQPYECREPSTASSSLCHDGDLSLLWQPYECREPSTASSSLCHDGDLSLLWQPYECREPSTASSSLCHDGDLSLLWEPCECREPLSTASPTTPSPSRDSSRGARRGQVPVPSSVRVFPSSLATTVWTSLACHASGHWAYSIPLQKPGLL